MGRQQIDGDSIRDESIEGVDIKDGSLTLDDLGQDVINAIENGGAVDYETLEPMGFNREDYTSMPIMEFCRTGASGEYERIYPDGSAELITGVTTFGDGVTDLGDRVFCIRPDDTLGEYRYWYKTVKHICTTTKTIQLPISVGKHIVTFVGESLTLSMGIHDAIVDEVICSVIYQDETGDCWLFADEKHGKEMNGIDHIRVHMTQGCVYESGFDILGIEAGKDTYDKIEAGVAWDEDIKLSTNECFTNKFIYKGPQGSWMQSVDRSNRVAMSSDNTSATPTYCNIKNEDGTWSLQELGHQEYVIYHFLHTNDTICRNKKIVGQNLYTNLVDARAALPVEVKDLEIGGLPSPELLFLYSVIVGQNGEIAQMEDALVLFDLRRTRLDFNLPYIFEIPRMSSAEIAALPMMENKMFWHNEAKKYLVSDPLNDRWIYIGFDNEEFLPPSTPGTFIEDWSDDLVDIKTRWTGNICENKDSPQEEFWSFEIDETASSSTGPDLPHSGTHYIYNETSGEGDTIDYFLETAYFATLTEVDFWHYAYGNKLGTYSLDWKDEDGVWTTIWSGSGDLGQQWNNVVVDFTGLGVVAIRFRHVDMTGYRADWAIDTIKITSV